MSKLYVKTTQNVPLFFTPAAVQERMFAYTIDLLVQIAYGSAITWISIKILSSFVDNLDSWGKMAYFGIIYLPVMFYTLVSEYFTGGQTLGKKIMKIRVIKIDGFEASFYDYFTRWISRVIDIYLVYIPGLLSMIITEHSQRIGDLIAGTAVITDKQKYNISHTILSDIEEENYSPIFLRTQVLKLSDDDMRIIKDNYGSALMNMDFVLLARLTKKIEDVTQKENPFTSEQEFIECLMKDYSYYTGAI